MGDFFVGVGCGVVVFISFVGGVVVCYFLVVSCVEFYSYYFMKLDFEYRILWIVLGVSFIMVDMEL